MPNSFSGDGRWKALWRFESNPGINVDSIGSLTLTNNGASLDTTYYKEGSSSCRLVRSESDYLYIPDSSLPSDFPLKSGTNNNEICFAFWYRPVSTTSTDMVIFSKWSANSKRSFMILQYGSGIYVHVGKSGGTGASFSKVLSNLSTNRWYHIGGYFSGADKQVYIRIWDDTAQSIVADALLATASEVSPNLAAPFAIGCSYNSSDQPEKYGDGYIDELLIGAGKLAPHEIDLIRKGEYDGTADALALYQIDAELEYLPQPGAKATQIVVEVLYKPYDPNQRVYDGSLQTTITVTGTSSQHWQYGGTLAPAITVSATYYYQAASEYIYISPGIPTVISPAASTVRGYVHKGQLAVALTTASQYSYPVRGYTGSIALEISVRGTSRVPVPGWDPITGYGLLDVSWLEEPPPFYVVMGELGLIIRPDAAQISLYAEYDCLPVASLRISGVSTVRHVRPDILDWVSAGGPCLQGEIQPDYIVATVQQYLLTAEIYFGGGITAAYSTPSLAETLVDIRGGVRLAGSGQPQHHLPADLVFTHTATVILKVGTVRLPGVEHVRAPEIDLTALQITVSPCLIAGGTAVCEFPEPPDIHEHVTRFGRIIVAGACGLQWLLPEITELILEPGILLTGLGEDAPELYYTVALHGYQLDPSLYSNYRFNSYAARNGRVLAAGDDGLYVLEGEDDDGKAIHTGVRIGPTTLGLNHPKRLRFLHLGACGEATVRIVAVRRGLDCYARTARGRYEPGRIAEDQELVLEIADFVTLSQIQMDLIILTNR